MSEKNPFFFGWIFFSIIILRGIKSHKKCKKIQNIIDLDEILCYHIISVFLTDILKI